MSIGELAKQIGGVSPWKEELWTGFVQVVLDLMREGAKRALVIPVDRKNWNENQYTAAVYLKMWEVRDEYQILQLQLQDEARSLNDGILNGTVQADECSRIDMIVRHCGMPRPIRLPIEAKILSCSGYGSRSSGTLVTAYLKDGLSRFVNGDYADGLRFGAMVAWVIDGNLVDTVTSVSARIVSDGFPTTSKLQAAVKPVSLGHYESAHPRLGKSEVAIHHLFVCEKDPSWMKSL